MRNVLERSSLVACGLLCLSLSQCGGKEFMSGDGAAGSANSGKGGQAQAGGTNGGAAGAAGDESSSGSAAGGRGGGGGTQPGCECPAGQYCRDGSTDCYPCADLSRLFFEPPVRLATVSDNGAGSRFPRSGGTSTDLLYHLDGVGVRYTADSSTSAGSSVSATLAEDTAPLLLKADVKTLLQPGFERGFNYLFDRAVGETRSLYFGRWDNGLQTAQLAPAPFNSDAGDYSAAVALNATPGGVARMFWMTKRALYAQLVTAPLSANAAPVPVGLHVGSVDCAPLAEVIDPSTQQPADLDLAPWVTDDGKLLVFSTTRLTSNCAAGSQKKDIYTTLLQASSGQPPPDTAAAPMNDVNSPEDDVDPSFSADLCDLYFASNREQKFAVYRAHRR